VEDALRSHHTACHTIRRVSRPPDPAHAAIIRYLALVERLRLYDVVPVMLQGQPAMVLDERLRPITHPGDPAQPFSSTLRPAADSHRTDGRGARLFGKA
jgi:hypothetical protein